MVTENFVGVLTQDFGKPTYYHNLYFKPATDTTEDIQPSTTNYNSKNPNFNITSKHQNSLENRGILEKNYARAEFVSTNTGKNTTKNMISTDSNYKENHTNVRCRKTSNEDNLVRTQFEKFSCDKHYLYLRNGTINSVLYGFCNSMYNGYPRNNINFSNKPRNKLHPRRLKYEERKTAITNKEETDVGKIMYRDNFLSEISHNCGTDSMHQNQNKSFKIFKLFKITNVSTTTEEMVEYAYSTVDVDEVVKNNSKISNKTSVMNIK